MNVPRVKATLQDFLCHSLGGTGHNSDSVQVTDASLYSRERGVAATLDWRRKKDDMAIIYSLYVDLGEEEHFRVAVHAHVCVGGEQPFIHSSNKHQPIWTKLCSQGVPSCVGGAQAVSVLIYSPT
jgi:hypothetical protein